MTIIPEIPGPALPNVKLLDNDGVPLESSWHRDEINLLVEQVRFRFRERKDYYVGGNMFIYFDLEQARNRNFRGPDFFFVDGVNSEPLRPYWVVWEEGGKYPDVIIELLSPSTAVEDRTTKKGVYERIFKTSDYFCYDPDSQELEGWQLVKHRYQTLAANDRGWLWSEELQLWLGRWDGPYQGQVATWLRFYDAHGVVVPLFDEAERQRAEAERQRAEAERQRAEAEGKRADAEGQCAEAEGKRAEAERQRAEAEIARLRQLLREQSGNADS